jgi:hypothetical protein
MASYIRKTKDINISPKLTAILEKISNRSVVAKMLLRAKLSKEDLVDDPIDYISISNDDPSKISYAHSDKLAKIDPEDYWKFKGRVNAKPAAAIKKFLKNVTEKDLDIFTCMYKAAVSNKDYTMQIVSGEEIKKYYHYRSYNDQFPGTLHNSCMKHENCSEFFDIYTQNPEVCTMLIMLDLNEKLLGRALLWDAIDMTTGVDRKVMDRIYAVNDDKNIHYFKEWADDNGYLYKTEQKWQNCMFLESHGVSKQYKLSVKIKKQSFVKYPYVDTFKFWDERNSTISNFLPEKDNGYIRTLIGNDGKTFPCDILSLDIIQQMYFHSDQMVPLRYINARTHSENTYYSETNDMYIIRDHTIRDEEIQDYLFNEEYSQFNNATKIAERREQYKKYNENNKKKSNKFTGYGNPFDDFYETTTRAYYDDIAVSPVEEAPIEEALIEEAPTVGRGGSIFLNDNTLSPIENVNTSTWDTGTWMFGMLGDNSGIIDVSTEHPGRLVSDPVEPEQPTESLSASRVSRRWINGNVYTR